MIKCKVIKTITDDEYVVVIRISCISKRVVGSNMSVVVSEFHEIYEGDDDHVVIHTDAKSICVPSHGMTWKRQHSDTN